MTDAELAHTKELAFWMTERVFMNPISAKLLNEDWRKAFPDEVAVAERMKALVEALEKAQRRIVELENYAEAEAIGADKAAEDGVYWMKRCKELESRTVKLPKPISVLHRREFTAAHCAIYAYPEAEVNAALDGAGIKWEAE